MWPFGKLQAEETPIVSDEKFLQLDKGQLSADEEETLRWQINNLEEYSRAYIAYTKRWVSSPGEFGKFKKVEEADKPTTLSAHMHFMLSKIFRS